MQLLHHAEFRGVRFEAVRPGEQRDMLLPLEPGLIDQGGTTDGNLADVGGQGGSCADAAEQRVPAIGNLGGVQEREIEGEEALGTSAGLDTLEDGFVLVRREVGGIFDVRQTHGDRVAGAGAGAGDQVSDTGTL